MGGGVDSGTRVHDEILPIIAGQHLKPDSWIRMVRLDRGWFGFETLYWAPERYLLAHEVNIDDSRRGCFPHFRVSKWTVICR